MKRMLTFMILVLLAGATCADACDGMVSLFADQAAGNCSAEIGYCAPVPLYLLYVRGTGPAMGHAVAFRLLKSTTDAMFLAPQWSGESLTFGSLEAGIDLTFNNEAAGGWCSDEEEVSYIGSIPVVNFADPDTFTVSVVDQPIYSGIFIVLCEAGYPMREVTGGTFVFNGTCNSPENPFGTKVAVAQSSWGAIKDLFR